ncbi:hypothetical protein V1971_19155, partial [Pseudomonas aeruginosa]
PWLCGMMLQFQFNDRVALSSCNRPDYYKIDSVLMALKINKTERIHASPLGGAFKVRREVLGFL